MARQPPTPELHLYKETRTDARNPLGSIIQIQISQPSSFAVRPRQTRHILRIDHAFPSQDGYRNYHLATSASIFHSQSSKFPRSLLWRVVQTQKTLELRFVDLSKDGHESKDAIFTLQLQFDSELRHGGIALADTEDVNVINVFALTKANEVYTIALRRAFFCDPKASEEDVSRWRRIARPATFSISAAHGLIAASPSQLIVSLTDGRVLQLTKNRADDGSRWSEAIYGDGHWASSFRGLVRWQGSNTVLHDGNTLEQTTPLSLAMSPDHKHIFAVTMNHALRVWNLSKGSIAFSEDLVGQPREQQDVPKHLIDPSSSSYLQILKLSACSRGYKYCALVFSPPHGEFKFWAVRDPDFGEKGVRDAFPGSKFLPPDPDPDSQSQSKWKMIDFVACSGQDDQEIELRLLLQSGLRCKMYTLRCNFDGLPDQWTGGWTCTAMHASDDSNIPRLSSLTHDMAEEWLDHILKPLRYPEVVIESALMMYRVNHKMQPADRKIPLKARLCAAVQDQTEQNGMGDDPEDQRLSACQEWTTLWQYIRDCNALGSGAISLSVDAETNIPWIALYYGCSTVRTCSRLETIVENKPDVLAISHEFIELPSVETALGGEPKLPDELAVVIEASAALRRTFSSPLLQNFELALSQELWETQASDTSARLEEFSKRCNFEEDLEDDALNALDTSLESIEGLANLDTDAFFAITDSFSSIISDTPSGLAYSKSGIRTLIVAARDMISCRQNVLNDLIACTAIATTEVDQNDTAMQYFDGPQVFERLLQLLRQILVMRWLVDHTNIDVENERTRRLGTRSPKEHHIDWKPTLLESLFAVDLTPQSAESQSHCEAFTHSVEDLLQWTMGGKEGLPLDEVVVHIQCNILKHRNIRLASDFLTFQPSTPWSTYVKGRLHLMKGQIEEAATYFEEAAPKLSKSSNINKYALKDLLSPKEAAHFGEGLATYCSHIIDLFNDSSPSCPIQAAYFADFALSNFPDRASSDQHTQLLKSLFNASLQTQNFRTAHSALTRHPSPEKLLPDFVSTMLATPGATHQLLSLSWPSNLHRHIDSLLSTYAKPKTVAAWRLHQDDFQGAAAALLPSLYRLQARVRRSADVEEQLEAEYLTIINLLECAGKENAWVLSGGISGGGSGPKEKRKLVTVDDLRAAHQNELDRRSMMYEGAYAFTNGHDAGDGDEMDLL